MNSDTSLREKLKILDLSVKEERVLMALQQGFCKPLEISRATRVTRPAVYDIFKKLKKRGLVESRILNSKKSWYIVGGKELADSLYEAKKVLLQFSDGKEEVSGVGDSTIVVHRGKEAVRNMIFGMFQSHKQERFLALSGHSPLTGWLNALTPSELNDTNKIIKRNSLITELVTSTNWIEEHYKTMGIEWAKDYEGRTASTVYVDKKYLNHAGQLFAFKNSLYLLALNDELIIEIRHSDIQKMLLSMFAFIKDHGEVVDANRLLRELMEKEEKVTSAEEKN